MRPQYEPVVFDRAADAEALLTAVEAAMDKNDPSIGVKCGRWAVQKVANQDAYSVKLLTIVTRVPDVSGVGTEAAQ